MWNDKRRLGMVVVYALAMAWVESATVVYLRTLTGHLQPYQLHPSSVSTGLQLAGTETVREAATLVMLLAVGWLAGRSLRGRLAYTWLAFGIWDIFYYIFLAVIGPWPRSILDWDVLFLIPLPWWGPVIAPVAVSIVLILSGILISQYGRPDHPVWPAIWAQIIGAIGAGLILYAFLENSIHIILSGYGDNALGDYLPTQFNWLVFLAGWFFFAVPTFDMVYRVWKESHPPRDTARLQ